MRAAEIPIEDLRKKAAADPGGMTLEEIQVLAAYKKLLPSGTNKDSKLTKTGRRKKKPGRKPKPLPIDQRIEKQRQRDLDAIDAKLDAGIPLTASDRKMQADMLEAIHEIKSKAEVNAAVRHAIEKGLGPEKVSSIHELIRLRDTSSRDDVRASCACKIIDIANSEAEPDEDFEIEAFDPSVPIPTRTVVTEKIVKLKAEAV